MTDIKQMISRTVGATIRSLGFLTRLPLSKSWFKKNHNISADAYVFPLAGMLIGFCGAFILLVATVFGLSPPVAAFFAVLTLVIITGALHEDGISDVADAFFAIGSTQERLAIMKDSHIGVFGTLALIFTIGLRICLLAAILIKGGPFAAYLSLIAVEAASRGALVWFWCNLPLARRNGTAAKAGEPDTTSGLIALSVSCIIFAIFTIPARGIIPFILAIALVSGCFYLFTSLCRAKIGGYTGDTLGAIQQIAAIALLTGLAAGL